MTETETDAASGAPAAPNKGERILTAIREAAVAEFSRHGFKASIHYCRARGSTAQLHLLHQQQGRAV